MLLLRQSELVARLPVTFSNMDIRDLVKTDVSHRSINPNFSHISNRGDMLGSRHSASDYNHSSTFPLPHPNIQSLHYGVLPPTDPSSFSRPSPSVWHSDSGFFAEPVHPQSLNPQQPRPLPLFKPTPSSSWPKPLAPSKRTSPSTDLDEGPPPKKSSTKWNTEENRTIIALRGQGMKWSDISSRIPGRTELACRLHYQNYLEKRGDWDEERKNKLARVYERCVLLLRPFEYLVTPRCEHHKPDTDNRSLRMKEEMWKPVATELGIPWRTAEGMHWIIGEQEMARRANVHPFSATLQPSSSTSINTNAPTQTTGRLGKVQRFPNPAGHFDEQEVAAIQPPAFPNLNGPGPTSTFTVPLPPLGPPSVQSFIRPGEVSDIQVFGSSHPRGEGIPLPSESDSSRPAVTPLHHHFHDIHQTSTENGTPALLPSVAELEGGVSPFTMHDNRKGSTSSASDGQSSNGKPSPRRETRVEKPIQETST